jgi:hypothetical protein
VTENVNIIILIEVAYLTCISRRGLWRKRVRVALDCRAAKRRLAMTVGGLGHGTERMIVFCFFFSKKEALSFLF